MSYQLRGVISDILPLQKVSEKFSKREFIIETNKSGGPNNFTEVIKFQLTNDRCDLINPYTEGQEIIIHFNIKGRKWEKDGKVSYFTNLEAWRIESTEIKQEYKEDFPQPSVDEIPPDTDNDLPF